MVDCIKDGTRFAAVSDCNTSPVVEKFRAFYYSLFQLLIRLVGNSATITYAIGCIMGKVRYWYGYIGKERSRQIYLDILGKAMLTGDKGRLKGILYHFWENHEKMLLELFLINQWPEIYLKERVQIRGREHLESALKRERGIILAVPHFGNERIVHLSLGYQGIETAVLTSRFEGAHMRVRKAKLLATETWNIIRYPDQNARWLYQHLEKGGILQLSPTAPGGVRDPVISFLGHAVKVSATPARLALKTGAVLLPVFDYREADNSHTVHILPPLNSNGEKKLSWRTLTEELLHLIEEKVRESPEQFYWMWLAIRSQEMNS